MLTTVTIEDLDAARTAGATILDVRESDEYAAGHVPGAQLLPLGLLPVRLQDLPRAEPVYLVCQSGGRSFQAAQLLDQAGLDARTVTGGTAAWTRSGRPVETGAPRQS
ncbi:MAG: moeZ 4 [Frankiales bacterium]|nr:moeZ 4 [Frankiales bacterium]